MNTWPRLKRGLLIAALILWVVGMVGALLADGWWRLPGVAATVLALAVLGFAMTYRRLSHGEVDSRRR